MKKSSMTAGLVLLASLTGWTPAEAGVVTEWNAITLSCVQGGPHPAKRGGPAGLLDIALVQAAVHDAVQAIQGRFEPYHYENPAMRGKGSPEAAAAAAAYGVLVAMYAPAECLKEVPDPAVTYAGDPGLEVGAEAAAALLPLRRPTVSLPPWYGNDEPGQWRPTPGVKEGASTFLAVTAPFAMRTPGQFRPEPPPRLKSWRYFLDYYEVKALGSLTDSRRTPEQDELAQFWTANYFTQWNEAVRAIADQHVPEIGDQARLFALLGFVTADSQISVYEAKYLWNYWRPITAIQEGSHDGNPLTVGDPSWQPRLQTPPYPEYSSGANCITAAVTTLLRRYFGRDRFEFAVWSTADGLNVNPRTYERFSQAADEVVDARIYQGIHFRTADVVGRRQGTRIAHWTFDHYLQPVKRRK